MPQSLGSLLIHIVFSTKNRYPFLTEKNIRTQMHAYIGGTCKNLKCPVFVVGGTADHVHIFCRLSRSLSVSKLIAEIKINSSKWVKTKDKYLNKFAWQNGYGAFSVGESDIEKIRDYILDQEKHHSIKSFQEEFLEFLKENQIEYDRRYVWD